MLFRSLPALFHDLDDRMEPASKVVEQRGEIALLGDGLADFEQGFELTPGVFERGGERHFRRGDDGIRHRRQDNTRVGGGSTLGVRGWKILLCRGRGSGSAKTADDKACWLPFLSIAKITVYFPSLVADATSLCSGYHFFPEYGHDGPSQILPNWFVVL